MITSVLLQILEYLLRQFLQILPYWLLGAAAGAFVIVFAKEKIVLALQRLEGPRHTLPKLALAAALGVASPLCMYGTIPLIYAFGKKGVPQHLLAAFMVSSILLNPNLFFFSFALGAKLALLRLFVCLLAGVAAGLLVKRFYRRRALFDFERYTPKDKPKPGGKPVMRVLREVNNTILKTFPYVLAGIALAALFETFVPKEAFASLFADNRGFGVLLAAGLGVPVYLCGGGTIPMLAGWLSAGMSLGSAAAFMVTGPATKFSNLGAVKIILGARSFMIYIAYTIIFAVISGLLVDIIHTFIQ